MAAMLGRSMTTVNLDNMSQTQQTAVARPTKNPQKMRNSITADTLDTFRTNLTTMPPMRSVRFHGPEDIRVEDIDEPVCGREVEVFHFADRYFSNVKSLTRADPTSFRWDLR